MTHAPTHGTTDAPIIAATEAETIDYLATLPNKMLAVAVVGPAAIQDLMEQMAAGSKPAYLTLKATERCINASPGMPCIVCDEPISDVCGAVVHLGEDDFTARARLVVPVCQTCAAKPNVDALAHAGIKRSIFPDARFFSGAMIHQAGHA